MEVTVYHVATVWANIDPVGQFQVFLYIAAFDTVL